MEEIFIAYKGRIISGYQGVGKSSEEDFIDLESSNLWVNGERSPFWYKEYASMAYSIAKQRHDVAISSHKVVRDEVAEYPDDVEKILVFPALEIKDIWIERLLRRLNPEDMNQDNKHYRALMNAKEKYEENILDLREQKGFFKVEIATDNYILKNIVDCASGVHHYMNIKKYDKDKNIQYNPNSFLNKNFKYMDMKDDYVKIGRMD